VLNAGNPAAPACGGFGGEPAAVGTEGGGTGGVLADNTSDANGFPLSATGGDGDDGVSGALTISGAGAAGSSGGGGGGGGGAGLRGSGSLAAGGGAYVRGS